MSRLLDRLERVNRGATNSMGFGNVARAEKVPPMVLLGTLSDPGKSAQGASILAQIGADGTLIEGMSVEEIKEKLIKPLDKVPWESGSRNSWASRQVIIGSRAAISSRSGQSGLCWEPSRTRTPLTSYISSRTWTSGPCVPSRTFRRRCADVHEIRGTTADSAAPHHHSLGA